MKKTFSIRDAKIHFTKLIRRACDGEEIIISDGYKPVAKLTAYTLDTTPRTPGIWKGKVRIAKDFDRLIKM
jgi:prevent-host-death family protein